MPSSNHAQSGKLGQHLCQQVADAREQLAELIPANGTAAAQALRMELHDKLETVRALRGDSPSEGTLAAPDSSTSIRMG